jgi:hypothetical protein
MKTYFHGSYEQLPVGTILKPKENYEEIWGETDFYFVLEKYRPQHLLPHKESVFMCDNPQDIDNTGGGTDWLFTVLPDEYIQKHDQSWCSEISLLIDNDENQELIEQYAFNYWNGISSENPVWEYLTKQAKIIVVEEY